MAVELYEHNQETYLNMIRLFREHNRVCVIQPTGTGKSFLYLKLIEDNPGKTFLVLAPSTEIFRQLRGYAGSSGDLHLLSSVRFLTYQALCRMEESELLSLCFDYIVLDEFHRVGAEHWGFAVDTVLSNKLDSKVFGATATPIRYLDSCRSMASELFNDVIARNMSLGEAVVREILPMPVYVPVLYGYDDVFDAQLGRIHKIEDPKLRAEALEKLNQLRAKLQSAYGVSEVLYTFATSTHCKFVVFCKSAEHVEEMRPVVTDWVRCINSNVRTYVSLSDTDSSNKEFLAFKYDMTPDAVRLLFVVDRFNEGVHLKDIDGVLMLRPTESPVIYLQQIGRALATGSLHSPLVFDLVNNYVGLCTYAEVNVFEKECLDAAKRMGAEKRVDSDEVGAAVLSVFESVRNFLLLLNELEHLVTQYDPWEVSFGFLARFVQEHGRLPFQHEKFEDKSVGCWLWSQKRLICDGKLSKVKCRRLESLGLDLSTCGDRGWSQYFELLKRYCVVEGSWPKSTYVYDGVLVGRWACAQLSAARLGKGLEVHRQLILELAESVGRTSRHSSGRYTEDELEILRTYYPSEGKNVCKRLPGRTVYSVVSTANNMGLFYEASKWTEAELEILRTYYPLEGGAVVDRLQGRTRAAVCNYARRLGLRVGTADWTAAELDILRTYYPLEGSGVVSRLPGRTKSSVSSKAQTLGIVYMQGWTPEEDDILREFYYLEGSAVCKRLVNRSVNACALRARKLGLLHKAPRLAWSDEEIAVLRRFYPLEGQEVQKRLPNRTVNGIVMKAHELGVSRQRVI